MVGTFHANVEMSGKMSSCIPKFNCTETVPACCDDNYVYKCEYFQPQEGYHTYCRFDPNRCGGCLSFDAIRTSMIRLLKKDYGLGTTRWKKVSLNPIDYGEEGWNT